VEVDERQCNKSSGKEEWDGKGKKISNGHALADWGFSVGDLPVRNWVEVGHQNWK